MFDLLDIQREINNRSFYEFVKYFWQDVDTSEYIDNWHIEYLCSIMQEAFEKWQRKENAIDIIINIPPGTSKTMICSKLFNAWVWTIEPKVKFITCSYSDNISKSNGMKTRDLISSDRFRQMYKLKLKKDNNNKAEFENTKGGYRLSLGIGGSLTGRHGDFIIFDDPENPKMAYSEAHREQSKQGLITLSTRKTDKLRSITIVIQQRLSFADVTSVLLAREKEYKHICLPAIVTDDIKPEHIKERYINGYLDPIRLNEEALNNNKIDLGIDAYFCQFLQAPANEKNGIFKKEWFNFYKEITYKECYIFVDTAQKTKEYNDYSAFGVFAVVNDNLYLLEIVNKNGYL